MIQLTRINRVPLVLNSDLIEHIETTPDTVVCLTTGQKFVVRESVEEVIRKVIAFRREVHRCDHWGADEGLREISLETAPEGSEEDSTEGGAK